ncbi:hypothetical protein ACFOLA_04380 [Salinicoccus hispanicus]|uniref:Uncharacterized protein n=1 Tax=Salinicoccus hispanicus TaxID=157225 RepID=A0A6N8U2R8_9STAP|nr:hypothetical protein [Salinicoccus hispanicus]MXQ52052.1 hypothetical protein [Salinicoccus hispanicus]
MSKINGTAALVGFAWLIFCSILLMTVFEEWYHRSHFVLLIIPLGMFFINYLFEYILKYDYFDRDYERDEK